MGYNYLTPGNESDRGSRKRPLNLSHSKHCLNMNEKAFMGLNEVHTFLVVWALKYGTELTNSGARGLVRNHSID